LTSIQNSLQRVLETRGSIYHLRKDVQFEKSRKVLASHRKELTKQEKGNKPNTGRPISKEEEEPFIQNWVLWYTSPKQFFSGHCGGSLQNILVTGQGMRGGNEVWRYEAKKDFLSGDDYLV